jgi:hypothetical protein
MKLNPSVLCTNRAMYDLFIIMVCFAPFYRQRGTAQAVRLIGGVEVYLYSFLTTALERGEGSASRPVRSLPSGGS